MPLDPTTEITSEDVYTLAVDGTLEKQTESFDLTQWALDNADKIIVATDVIGKFTIETKFLCYDKNKGEKNPRFFETLVNHSDAKTVNVDVTPKMHEELFTLNIEGGNYAATREEALANHAKIVAIVTNT